MKQQTPQYITLNVQSDLSSVIILKEIKENNIVKLFCNGITIYSRNNDVNEKIQELKTIVLSSVIEAQNTMINYRPKNKWTSDYKNIIKFLKNDNVQIIDYTLMSAEMCIYELNHKVIQCFRNEHKNSIKKLLTY